MAQQIGLVSLPSFFLPAWPPKPPSLASGSLHFAPSICPLCPILGFLLSFFIPAWWASPLAGIIIHSHISKPHLGWTTYRALASCRGAAARVTAEEAATRAS